MEYQIAFASSFRRCLKKLEKRYHHVRDDVRAGIEELLKNPRKGKVIPGGGGVRKSRLANSDLNKGKSGGYRLLYYIEGTSPPIIYLLLLYAKSDQANVTRYELRRLLAELREEM
jgi:mRNA-degrading endonuclease RelE of RelBE toxin-antitoxin system